jgi:hypothetical protein
MATQDIQQAKRGMLHSFIAAMSFGMAFIVVALVLGLWLGNHSGAGLLAAAVGAIGGSAVQIYSHASRAISELEKQRQ